MLGFCACLVLFFFPPQKPPNHSLVISATSRQARAGVKRCVVNPAAKCSEATFIRLLTLSNSRKPVFQETTLRDGRGRGIKIKKEEHQKNFRMDLLCCVMDDSGATSHIAPSLCELYINDTMNGGRMKDNVFQISSTKGKKRGKKPPTAPPFCLRAPAIRQRGKKAELKDPPSAHRRRSNKLDLSLCLQFVPLTGFGAFPVSACHVKPF